MAPTLCGIAVAVLAAIKDTVTLRTVSAAPALGTLALAALDIVDLAFAVAAATEDRRRRRSASRNAAVVARPPEITLADATHALTMAFSTTLVDAATLLALEAREHVVALALAIVTNAVPVASVLAA